jgi:hypothetical protein
MQSSTISIGGTDGPSMSARSPQPGDRVYFRSSDVEFWQISSVTYIASLVSAKYVRWGQVPGASEVDYAQNHSLEYRLGDATESVAFSPEQDMRVAFDRMDLTPDWSTEVAAFVSAGKTTINAMRLDIGGGGVTFVIDGSERTVNWADGSGNNGINGNSIFFVDRAYLKKPVLVTRDIESGIIDSTASAESLGLTAAEYELVETIHRSSNWVDSDSPIDVQVKRTPK